MIKRELFNGLRRNRPTEIADDASRPAGQIVLIYPREFLDRGERAEVLEPFEALVDGGRGEEDFDRVTSQAEDGDEIVTVFLGELFDVFDENELTRGEHGNRGDQRGQVIERQVGAIEDVDRTGLRSCRGVLVRRPPVGFPLFRCVPEDIGILGNQKVDVAVPASATVFGKSHWKTSSRQGGLPGKIDESGTPAKGEPDSEGRIADECDVIRLRPVDPGEMFPPDWPPASPSRE